MNTLEMASGGSDVCKSPSTSELKHRQMYKVATPPWKDSYRKRCRDQLAKNRHKFLEKFRNLASPEEIAASVKEVLASELNELKSSLRILENDNPGSEDSIDDILMMFDEINAELASEEQKILNQYEEWFDEEALCSSFMNNMQANEVICPICQRNPLLIRLGIVQCQCGLRIDTEQDAITAEMIQSNLTQAVEEHSTLCSHRPGFNVFQQQTISNILMSCEKCDFLYIII